MNSENDDDDDCQFIGSMIRPPSIYWHLIYVYLRLYRWRESHSTIEPLNHTTDPLIDLSSTARKRRRIVSQHEHEAAVASEELFKLTPNTGLPCGTSLPEILRMGKLTSAVVFSYQFEVVTYTSTRCSGFPMWSNRAFSFCQG